MLRDFTKADWLSMLAIPEDRVPQVLLLRGTRNLKGQYLSYARYFNAPSPEFVGKNWFR